MHDLDAQHQDVQRTLCGRVNQNDRGRAVYRGWLKNRTEQNILAVNHGQSNEKLKFLERATASSIKPQKTSNSNLPIVTLFTTVFP